MDIARESNFSEALDLMANTPAGRAELASQAKQAEREAEAMQDAAKRAAARSTWRRVALLNIATQALDNT